MLSRRQLISQAVVGCTATLGAAALATVSLTSRTAHATTAKTVSLPRLVGLSQHVLVGTPTDARSQWETVGHARRIVTYVRMEVAQSIDGRPPEERSVLVRTLGGQVGDIGQLVHGEARLTLKKETVVFLQKDNDGILSVTAMAQGHFPLFTDSKRVQRLIASPALPHLVNRQTSAASELIQKTVVEAEDLVCRCLLDTAPEVQ